MSKIIVHCLVKNEERFVWYAINSVLSYVDKLMVWDTGSTDRTVQIIKTIKSAKISFFQFGPVDEYSYTIVRQQMLEQTPSDFTWLMILDGDEIWPNKSIRAVIKFVRENPGFESVVVRTSNLVGDIYHKLPESAGKYHLAGHAGHLNLRFINLHNIPGLHQAKPHGQHGFFDGQGGMIQNRDPKKIAFIDVAYHHATHLVRSSSKQFDQLVVKRKNKYKVELGKNIPRDQIPEVFFASRPKIVPDVTQRASEWFWLQARLMTIPRRVKRFILPPKHGY